MLLLFAQSTPDTLNANEAVDVADISGNVAYTGVLAVTEDSDTASLAGNVASIGTLATTEAADTTSMFGSVGGVTGTLAVTETPATVAMTGTVAYLGTLAATESSPDTANLTGSLASATGTLAVTETADTAAFTGGPAATGTIAATGVSDTARISGALNIPAPPLGTIWPITLPQIYLIEGFAQGMGKNTYRFQSDVGPAKVRRRTTIASRPMSGSFYMTGHQLGIMKTFINEEIEGGALPFYFPAQPPFTGSYLVRLAEELPQWDYLAPDAWKVDLKLEILPP